MSPSAVAWATFPTAENVLPLVVILILSLVPAGSDLLAATRIHTNSSPWPGPETEAPIGGQPILRWQRTHSGEPVDVRDEPLDFGACPPHLYFPQRLA